MEASKPEASKGLNLGSLLSSFKGREATALLEQAAPAEPATSAEQSIKPLLEPIIGSQAVIQKNITSVFKIQEVLQADVKQIADQLNQLIQSIQSASAASSEQSGGRRKTLRVKKGKKPSRNRRT
jgi:hypothetical protein